jgi:hypothetical protein
MVALLVPEAVISVIALLYSEIHMLYVKSLVGLHNRRRTHLIKFLKFEVRCISIVS